MTIIRTAGRILCEIPPELRAELLSGAVRMTGSVLRNTKTGHIVGFLQEAAPLGRLLGTGVALAGGLAAGPGVLLAGAATFFGMQAASLVQGEFTRRGVQRTEAAVKVVDGKVDALGESMTRVEGTLGAMQGEIGSVGKGVDLLQSMGVANLAMGAAGIGVSVIGFGVMTAKLGQVQRAVHAMGDRIDSINAKLDQLRQDAIDADFADLLSLTGLYEEGWSLSGSARAEQQWQHVQQAALVMQNRFVDRARKLLSGSTAHIDAADPMLDAVALASSLRVASLVACDEAPLARNIANESARQIEGFTGTIGLVDLAATALTSGSEPGTHDYEITLAAARDAARPLLRKIRDRETAVATRAAPLEVLEERGISPRAWLEEARHEDEAPLLFLDGSK